MSGIGYDFIDIEKVKANNYNLVGRFYRESRKGSKYKIISINALCDNNVVIFEKGKTITKEKVEAGSVPVIRGGKKSPYLHNKSTHNDHIITISHVGTAGYLWYHDYPIWASDSCFVLYSNNEDVLQTKYLYYALLSVQQDINQLITGAAQKHLMKNDIKSIKIPLPLIEEQQKIVDRFEKERKYIESEKEIIRLSEQRIQDELNSLWN